MKETEQETHILLVKELLDRCGLRACDISLRGCAAGSIVLYLLGISEADPLKYGLEAEIIFGSKGNKGMDFDINVPAYRQTEMMKAVEKLSGVGIAVRIGSMHTVSYSFASAITEDALQDTELCYLPQERLQEIQPKLEGNYRDRGKHPGRMLLFPQGTDVKRMIPLAKATDGTPIFYFNYYYLRLYLCDLDLLSHTSPEMLIRLSEMTGVNLTDVPVDSPEVLELFQPDADGNVTKCAALPEFFPEETRKIVTVLKPTCFDDLVKISALSHGTGCWEDNAQILVEKEGHGINNIIASRDDVFEYILKLGVDRETAFEISDAVRKGIICRGRNTKWYLWKPLLIRHGTEDWFLRSCEKIQYLFPRAHAISYMIMNMRLGWFRVHYPEAFRQVMRQYHPDINY